MLPSFTTVALQRVLSPSNFLITRNTQRNIHDVQMYRFGVRRKDEHLYSKMIPKNITLERVTVDISWQ